MLNGQTLCIPDASLNIFLKKSKKKKLLINLKIIFFYRVNKSLNFDPYATKIARFFIMVKPAQTSIFVAVKQNICALASKVPKLQHMYDYVGTLDPEILIQPNKEDYIAAHSTLQVNELIQWGYRRVHMVI